MLDLIPVICTALDQCHDVGYCQTATGNCTQPNKIDGFECSIADNLCVTSAQCQEGNCIAVVTVVCSVPDQCHQTGICDTQSGVCSYTPVSDGSNCNDGNQCTLTDSCQSGICTGSNPVTCSAQDQCHDVGHCQPDTGVCTQPQKVDGFGCILNDDCATAAQCSNGQCIETGSVTCAAPDQCHEDGICDSTTGQCTYQPKANGFSCNDGNACTQDDSCQSGICIGSNPIICNLPDQCHDAGTCDPTSGVCSNPRKADGTTCDDGNSCTQQDNCLSGTCTGSNPVVCTAQDQCHVAGTCNPSSGICNNPAKDNGVTCDDANSCTLTDTCQSGFCIGSNLVVCTSSDQCHNAGVCDPSNGVCSNPTKDDGSVCNDGNACTLSDSCQSGSCTSSNSVVCTASDQCHDVGVCDPSNGVCSNPTMNDGTTCNDGNACTQTDTCQSGSCSGTNPIICSILDQCHNAGVCDPSNGVCNNPTKDNNTICNDGNGCTQTDTCQSGICTGANPIICIASDQCHDVGVCDSSNGVCSNPAKNNGTNCNDGNACTKSILVNLEYALNLIILFAVFSINVIMLEFVILQVESVIIQRKLMALLVTMETCAHR